MGEFFSSLVGRIFRETTTDAANWGMAAYANRHKPGNPPPTSVNVGWMPMTLNVSGFVLLCSPVGFLLYYSLWLGQPAPSVWLIVASGVLAIFACLGLWDAIVRRIDWTETHVRFRKWNGEKIVPWSDIVNVEEKSFPPHWRVVLRDGSGFAVHEIMNGSRHFLRIIEIQLTPLPPDGKRRERRKRGKKS